MQIYKGLLKYFLSQVRSPGTRRLQANIHSDLLVEVKEAMKAQALVHREKTRTCFHAPPDKG